MISKDNKQQSVSSMPDDEKIAQMKEDALLDEAMKILAGYEEGCSPKDLRGFSDCGCCVDDEKHAPNKLND